VGNHSFASESTARCLIHCCEADQCGHIDHEGLKACPEDPVALAGMPIGQYHCPVCGCMAVAAVPHLQHDYGCLLGLDLGPAAPRAHNAE
jgi:hypothetical protein